LKINPNSINVKEEKEMWKLQKKDRYIT